MKNSSNNEIVAAFLSFESIVEPFWFESILSLSLSHSYTSLLIGLYSNVFCISCSEFKFAPQFIIIKFKQAII